MLEVWVQRCVSLSSPKGLVLKSKDAESTPNPITEKWGGAKGVVTANYQLTMDFC